MSNGGKTQNIPLVSIVTPTFNQAAFLRETIESVLSQDYPHLEYQIIDDGSTDSTPKILEDYAGRANIERHQNCGQTATINKGWERSTGEILFWLNSDDTLLPGGVRKAVDYLAEHPQIDIVFGDTLFTSEAGMALRRSKNRTGFEYQKFVVQCENPIPQPSAFIRRRVIEDIGLLDPSYYYFMDWDFWLRAGLRHQIAYFPELLSTYRLHRESKTVAQMAKAAPELEYMYSKFFAREDIPANIRGQQRLALANMCFTSGSYYLLGSDKRMAARMGFKALRTYPATLYRPKLTHKFIYCLLGGQLLYQRARLFYNNTRKILGNGLDSSLEEPTAD